MSNVTYRFDIEHHSNGSHTATCGKRSANDERKLARQIVEAGLPDGPLVVGRLCRTDYTVASLHHFAAGTLSEGEKGFTRGIYAPYPPREMHPALQRAIYRRVEAGKNGVSTLAAPTTPDGG